jgi:hypothetical protein
MSSITTRKYKILLTHEPLPEAVDGQPWRWRAIVLDFPSIVEEALSREQVIQHIQARIDDITRYAEVIALTAPALPLVQEGPEDALAAQGWDDHGLFRDDPEALQLFDTIEEERDRHRVGGA